jgi:hypothetical protein
MRAVLPFTLPSPFWPFPLHCSISRRVPPGMGWPELLSSSCAVRGTAQGRFGACEMANFREHSGNVQANFREHSSGRSGACECTRWPFKEQSGNIQGTFREHSGWFRACDLAKQGTFREHSGQFQGTFRKIWRLRVCEMAIQGIFREHSGNIQWTLRQHSGRFGAWELTTQWTFRKRSENIQGNIQAKFRERSGRFGACETAQFTFVPQACRCVQFMRGGYYAHNLVRRRILQGSLNLAWKFPECSLNVPWMFLTFPFSLTIRSLIENGLPLCEATQQFDD